MVDAAFGEVMVTCEKIWWLVKEGAQYLLPERRKAGAMVGTACLHDCMTAVTRYCTQELYPADCSRLF